MELTDKERLILETKLELLEVVYEKVYAIANADLSPSYYTTEIDRDMDRIKKKLKEPEVEPDRIDIAKPNYGPGETVLYSINGDGKEALFIVMEVNHKTQEYVLKSKIARSMTTEKPIKLMASWFDVNHI